MSWPDTQRLHWKPTLRVPSDDGTEIAVEILGDAHPGPTVVFTHGWTFSSRSWHYQRMLAERYRLVLMDHRDHGMSGVGPRANRTIDQIGRDLYAVLQATCADRPVVLVGHSMGGMTIMSLAAQHPELFTGGPAGSPPARAPVRAVAFVDTSAARDPADNFGLRGPLAGFFLNQWKSSLALMVNEPEKAERARRSGSRISVAISRFLNFGVKPDPHLTRFTEAMSAATPAQVVGDFYATLDTHDKLEALEALTKTPTLVIVGDRDRLTPPAHARAIAAAIPNARLIEVAGAGHCPMLEQPNLVNAALSELIEAAAANNDEIVLPSVAPKQKVRS